MFFFVEEWRHRGQAKKQNWWQMQILAKEIESTHSLYEDCKYMLRKLNLLLKNSSIIYAIHNLRLTL